MRWQLAETGASKDAMAAAGRNAADAIGMAAAGRNAANVGGMAAGNAAIRAAR